MKERTGRESREERRRDEPGGELGLKEGRSKMRERVEKEKESRVEKGRWKVKDKREKARCKLPG